MNRKIFFGGTIIINNRKLKNKAVMLENTLITITDNVHELIKTEPTNTFTDLINLNNRSIRID